jgi:hypothetical protein
MALNEVSASILFRAHIRLWAAQSIAGHRPVTFRCHCFFPEGVEGFDRPAAPIAVHLSLNVSYIGAPFSNFSAYGRHKSRGIDWSLEGKVDDFGYQLIRRMRPADRSPIQSAAPQIGGRRPADGGRSRHSVSHRSTSTS